MSEQKGEETWKKEKESFMFKVFLLNTTEHTNTVLPIIHSLIPMHCLQCNVLMHLISNESY